MPADVLPLHTLAVAYVKRTIASLFIVKVKEIAAHLGPPSPELSNWARGFPP
jgi:hypothetical protein